MKRKLLAVFCLSLALPWTACGDKENQPTDTQQSETELSAMTEVRETELAEATEVIVAEAEPEVTVLETVEFSDDYTSATKTIYSNVTPFFCFNLETKIQVYKHGKGAFIIFSVYRHVCFERPNYRRCIRIICRH